MILSFTKYQGTGNDFILIDNRNQQFTEHLVPRIPHLTHRKFGIGADGLILLDICRDADFQMTYYNADGSQSLCGNGSRCAVDYARSLGMFRDSGSFYAIDGIHNAHHDGEVIDIEIRDVEDVEVGDGYFFIENGSPHHVEFTDSVEQKDVVAAGTYIRHSEKYQPDGTNVNFVTLEEKQIKVRTYERGVEDETLSCGTGVVSAAIAASYHGWNSPIIAVTRGGSLTVSFQKSEKNCFRNIYLSGPVKRVFDGQIDI